MFSGDHRAIVLDHTKRRSRSLGLEFRAGISPRGDSGVLGKGLWTIIRRIHFGWVEVPGVSHIPMAEARQGVACWAPEGFAPLGAAVATRSDSWTV
jgi:hypothetical protein